MARSEKYLYALVENIRGALSRGNPVEARRILEKLRDEAPAHVITRGMEIEILLSVGSLGEAQRLSRELERLYPESPRILLLAGKVAYLRKDYDDATRLFRKSLAIKHYWSTSRWLAKSLTQAGEFEEAERLLVPLARDRPSCTDDLSWLYERMGEYERARTLIEQRHHGTKKSQSQRLRLEAASLPPDDLIEEMEVLLDLGEDPPPEVLPLFIAALFDTGRGQRARELVKERLETVSTSTANNLAWVCHNRNIFDLSFELFHRLPQDRLTVKQRSALERAAKLCNRLPELIETYQQLARSDANYYGRIKKLSKHLAPKQQPKRRKRRSL